MVDVEEEWHRQMGADALKLYLEVPMWFEGQLYTVFLNTKLNRKIQHLSFLKNMKHNNVFL